MANDALGNNWPGPEEAPARTHTIPTDAGGLDDMRPVLATHDVADRGFMHTKLSCQIGVGQAPSGEQATDLSNLLSRQLRTSIVFSACVTERARWENPDGLLPTQQLERGISIIVRYRSQPEMCRIYA